MRRLGAYLLALALIGAALELFARGFRTTLIDASHRALFKAALLDRRLPVDVVFFGSSRTGEALRPVSFSDELAAGGARRMSAFNMSVQYTSLEILDALATRFAAAPGLRLAIVEVTKHQLTRAPVPWSDAPAGADFDARVGGWLVAHSALVAARKVLVLDSLARLFAILAVGGRFDGTEQFGTDYAAKIFGGAADVDRSAYAAVECAPVASEGGDPSLFAGELEIYTRIAGAFSARGVQVVFYVPPMQDTVTATEIDPNHRALRAALHARTGAPVLDFSTCQLPPAYFRDAIHLSHVGGSHFSRMLARALAKESVARAVQ